jgi:hypothetical protein
MSNTNTVVNGAINTLNEAALNRAQQQASVYINRIRGLQQVVDENNSCIAKLQADLKAIEGDTITFESVVGQTPGNTANTATLVDTIDKMNKNRQMEIASRANPTALSIKALQDDNALRAKEIATLREELSKITVETIDAAAILG